MREFKSQLSVLLAVLLPSFLLLNLLGSIAKASPTIIEYQVPPTDNGFADTTFIANGPDGNIWFTQSIEKDVGSITPSGLVISIPFLIKAQELVRLHPGQMEQCGSLGLRLVG